jgi:hypothetical protein
MPLGAYNFADREIVTADCLIDRPTNSGRIFDPSSPFIHSARCAAAHRSMNHKPRVRGESLCHLGESSIRRHCYLSSAGRDTLKTSLNNVAEVWDHFSGSAFPFLRSDRASGSGSIPDERYFQTPSGVTIPSPQHHQMISGSPPACCCPSDEAVRLDYDAVATTVRNRDSDPYGEGGICPDAKKRLQIRCANILISIL